ncbi:hypothetical protein TVAG_003190 [Trichomonas vaginalis G3]|uniref:Uncharacterized protein n=1 Tax=Trichomonas vaginalis (strain ATCC PRA-98 / G3) TaxID=412133 RepID=A2FN71_TRIV3|nr:hypothetical protein TVAGG3_0669690 [Trichomonas vaginalis G3]EAX93630.1 hypothetical protein TVAG_003190 [Trichomonas vaginalis G3]KAI5507103.1 hypothetical protein TVAGG3_0669690 [Trichomonas vaginalis G3]|eukprot:XP_001306560.1 hypothetical protein [Trichomonas vaginalis G3]
MNNDQTMKNMSPNSSFSFLQDMYVYYFSNQNSAKNILQNNHPLLQFATKFNYDPFPRETIIKAIKSHQHDIEIFLPEALYLPTMISESYFEAAQYECDLPLKERIEDLKILSYDLMRALLAFEYQFKPEFIASNDTMQNKWRSVIYIIKCAADFPEDVLGDFLLITRVILKKLSASFQAIYSAGSDTITLYTTFVNSLIHLNHKSIKDTKSFDFLLGSICSHFKDFAVDP